MLSINTNISSYIAQRSLKNSTQLLNQAIERMTTGYKLNHASDNAANYSISTNQTAKLSAYQVAEDNASMGLDLLTTANDSLNLISDHLTRIRDLAIQAGNGTYGNRSLKAINAEVNARVNEIERLYNSTEYNGMKIFGELKNSENDNANYEVGFINPVTKRDTSAMTTLSSVDETVALTSGTYSISTAEELAKLATMTNNGLIGVNTEFVLSNDIDLSGYSSGEGWVPIGKYDNSLLRNFRAVFDGNGYVVKNLYINRPNVDYQGLFGDVSCDGTVKNVGVENCNVTGKSNVGAVIGYNEKALDNCYSTGNVTGKGSYIGGVVGLSYYGIKNSCADVKVNGSGSNVGGLMGWTSGAVSVANCFALGNVTGGGYVGGLVGGSRAAIENCYAGGNVVGGSCVGGLIGWLGGPTGISESKATGNVTGKTSVGGLVGSFTTSMYLSNKNNFATGNVQGEDYVGGLLGSISALDSGNPTLVNNKSSGTVTGSGQNVDDFIGYISPGVQIDSGSGADVSFGNILDDVLFQVGVNSSDFSQIYLNTSFTIENLAFLRKIGTKEADYLNVIDNINSTITAKQVEYGACQNRLESALDEISIHYENLASSRSTLRDADITKVSSEYIRQQILQQASATLMATANQSPSIALQLL